MSARAMRLAVRDRLQAVLELDADSCDEMPDGQPKPACGELFVAVHAGGGWTGASGDCDLSEYIGCVVTVTRRLGYAPQDVWAGEVLSQAALGLEATMREVLVAVHMSYLVMNAANAYIDADQQAPAFVEPLRFQQADDRPSIKGPDWFSATLPETDADVAEAGLAWAMTFGRALRQQGIAEGVVT